MKLLVPRPVELRSISPLWISASGVPIGDRCLLKFGPISEGLFPLLNPKVERRREIEVTGTQGVSPQENTDLRGAVTFCQGHSQLEVTSHSYSDNLPGLPMD